MWAPRDNLNGQSRNGYGFMGMARNTVDGGFAQVKHDVLVGQAPRSQSSARSKTSLRSRRPLESQKLARGYGAGWSKHIRTLVLAIPTKLPDSTHTHKHTPARCAFSRQGEGWATEGPAVGRTVQPTPARDRQALLRRLKCAGQETERQPGSLRISDKPGEVHAASPRCPANL